LAEFTRKMLGENSQIQAASVCFARGPWFARVVSCQWLGVSGQWFLLFGFEPNSCLVCEDNFTKSCKDFWQAAEKGR